MIFTPADFLLMIKKYIFKTSYQDLENYKWKNVKHLLNIAQKRIITSTFVYGTQRKVERYYHFTIIGS